MSKKQIPIFIIIVILALATRFLFLGLRPIHHDEGMLSYFAWQLSEGGGYVYTPQIHGPILFYLQALFFKFFGGGDAVVRASTALFGVILVCLPLAIYRKLGIRRSIAIAILTLASPLLLYFSRFLVHTALIVAINLAIVIILWLLAKKPRPVYFYLLAVLSALAFGISETSYIFFASLIVFVPCYFALFPKNFSVVLKRLKKYITASYLDVIASFLVFVLVWILIYSVGLGSARSLLLSLPNPFNGEGGLGFWLSQHENKLGGQPWFYYLLLMLVYEPLIFLGAILAAIESARRRGGALQFFIVVLAFLSLLAYSVAGEKFPWLILPTLVLFTFSAGLYFGSNYLKSKTATKIIIIMLGIFTIFNLYRLNYLDPADTRELPVYVQTPNSFREMVEKVRDACQSKDNECVVIDSSVSWPLSWEFREISRLDNLDENTKISAKTSFIFASADNARESFEGFTPRQVQLRDWWVPPVCRDSSCIGKFARYFFLRTIWGEKGGYEVTIFERE